MSLLEGGRAFAGQCWGQERMSNREMPVDGNRFSKKPLYLQLRDVLAERISEGVWKPGEAIPNEGELAREFGVSAGTMRKALDLMEAERILSRRQGRGTFVNDQTTDEFASRFSHVHAANGQLAERHAKVTHVAKGVAGESERRRLQLGPGESVYRIQRTCLHKNKPFMVEHAAVPAALFPGLDANPEAAGRITALAQQYGVLLGKAEERLAIGQAPDLVTGALGVAPDTPVMVLDRVVHTLDGRAAEWRVGWCHLADRYYRAELV
jgi:GntR family transcriptional regulator